jgi:ribokinase
MFKILVIGSSNTDMVVKTARFPQPGETIIGGEFFMFPGGKGANQAVAAARMGGHVTLIAKVGDDVFGQQALDGFVHEGINVDYVFTDNELASGVALITVNGAGENEIVVAPGANAALHSVDLDQAESAFAAADLVLMQLETPVETVLHAAAKTNALGKRFVLNPAPAQVLPAELFPHLFLITPNETEATLLTGIALDDDTALPRIAEAFLQKGVANVIITLGARGAYFHNVETHFSIAAPKVEAVDTTAAGDVFNGALAVALAEGMDWPEAIKVACQAGALAVTRMGAQASAPFREEL